MKATTSIPSKPNPIQRMHIALAGIREVLQSLKNQNAVLLTIVKEYQSRYGPLTKEKRRIGYIQ